MRETAEALLLLAYGDCNNTEIDRLEDDLNKVSGELKQLLQIVCARNFLKEDI